MSTTDDPTRDPADDPNDDELDDLLQPTVATHAPRTGPLPFRLGSQFWVAFFGGTIAVTFIALVNAARLRMPVAKRWWIVAVGVLGVLASAGVFYWVEAGDAKSTGSTLRLAWRVVGVLVYLVLRKIQDRDDDHHTVFGGGEYASMWIPGILACVAGFLTNALLLLGVRSLLS